MKILTVAIVLSTITIATCSAQNRIIPVSQPTTEEEYNYVTRGYAAQISEGLDMKKGYNFKDLGTVQQGNYSFTIKILLREATNEVAAQLIIVKSLQWNHTYYICVPHGNQQLENRYAGDVSNWDLPLTRAYMQLFTLGWGAAVANLYEAEKRTKN